MRPTMSGACKIHALKASNNLTLSLLDADKVLHIRVRPHRRLALRYDLRGVKSQYRVRWGAASRFRTAAVSPAGPAAAPAPLPALSPAIHRRSRSAPQPARPAP